MSGAPDVDVTGRQRFRELDGLRAIAALAVVATHFIDSYPSTYTDAEPWPVEARWGDHGVHLFFLISGFVILMSARRARGPSDFVIARFSRLYPAYWIALTVSILLAVAFRIPGFGIPWVDRIANYSMLQRFLLMESQEMVYWTLAIELQFYALVLVLLVTTRAQITDRLVVAVSTLWMSVSLVGSVVLRPFTQGIDPQLVVTPVKMLQNLLVIEWGPYFCAGMLCFLARNDRKYAPWGLGALALAPVVSWNSQGALDGALAIPVVVLFGVVVFRGRTRALLVPPLQFVGRISYSLYITHTLAGFLVIHLLEPHLGRLVATFVAVALVLGYAWLLHRVGETILSRSCRTALVSLRDALQGRARPSEVMS